MSRSSEPARGALPASSRLPPRDRPFQRMGPVKSVAGALAATGTLVAPAVAARMFDRRSAMRVPMLWHRWICQSLGVRTRLHGRPATGSVLYVANHISWLDIPVAGSHLHGNFVAKSEVEDMGFVGFLADLQSTIYVERGRRQRAAIQAGSIVDRLREGGNVILFPEGTSNDGVRILPFKSTLFAALEGEAGRHFRIQPVTIAYTQLNGLPLTRNRMLDIAWIGDMELGPHAMDFMRLGRIEAHLQCHDPVRRADFADRKALALHCHDVIARGYRRLVRGNA